MIGLPSRRVVVLLLVFQPAFIAAFHLPAWKLKQSTRNRNRGYALRNTWSSCTTTSLSMGLYEDDTIDWDDDLFGQIGKQSDNKQSLEGDDGSRKEVTKEGGKSNDALDDDIWDMGQSKSTNTKSVREQMKQSWGAAVTDKDGSSEEGKPTADWVPRFGDGPDEDEPWFTG